MSGPDLIDGRFDELVRELRSGEATASPELRERVHGIAEGTRTSSPPAARFGRFRRRRTALVLVPVAAALAAAVGVGVFSSGGTGSKGTPALGLASPPKVPPLDVGGASSSGSMKGQFNVPPQNNLTGSKSAPAPSGSRAQNYAVELTLRVGSLSATTKRAIQLTRAWGGYVVTVDYGSGQKSGSAYLVLRVPVVRVQQAVARLSGLGTIADEHVSIQDVQGQLNRRFTQMQDVKATIAGLRAKLTDTTLSASTRAFFEATLARRVAQLARLQDEQSAQKARASFATISLDLETKKAAAAVPSKPGRIGQALHNIGRVLVTELEVVLYVLLIGAPFVLLAALLVGGRRTLRRRSENQLLAR
jgi:uncharacterized protein DUF4349